MHNRMQRWLNSSFLSGSNQSYIKNLYEDYLIKHNCIDDDWKKFFKQLLKESQDNNNQLHSDMYDNSQFITRNSVPNYIIDNDKDFESKQIKVLQLINAFRFYGHENADIDPLKLWRRKKNPELSPEFYGFKKEDFDKIFDVSSLFVNKGMMKFSEIYENLKRIYCGSIGVEYMHIKTEEKEWIQNYFESVNILEYFSEDEKRNLLIDLTAAEGLERHLGTKFPGAKRFSLEGGDVLIPMLKNIISYAGKQDISEIVLGMAHRGRLNVLVNILGKNPSELFNEFAGKYNNKSISGDVKYHQGFSSDFQTEWSRIHLSLLFNPSHLEIVNPVVIGSVRARLDSTRQKNNNSVLPVIIHGDSAITGQGVVQETLNMSQVSGYKVGGAIRIVINNQIGFTISNYKDTRSSEYCTDIVKMIRAPIFHVNADDPEAVVFVSRLALEFRNKFKSDIMIDLVCYRRHGHNEADEPNVTQPIMYKKIKQHKTTREIYANYLIKNKIFTKNEVDSLVDLYRKKLDLGNCVVNEFRELDYDACIWKKYINSFNITYKSTFDIKRLINLAIKISIIPKGIVAQSRVEKIYTDRMAMAKKEKFFDWGAAEMLAYATLVDDGISVRLSGEDVGRGTFFHRHAVVHNQTDGLIYVPLQNIHSNQGDFNVWDSVLSENAVLAFEYGYSITNPRVLTIWEAQFGDFSNCAQVVIDQFISSSEQKWGRNSGLVMLLPHGYEGQGPEHSSARLERYLQLCADKNMQVCIPSTPAQFYHMLRRQILQNIRRPLIVMSPKSLLRHPLAVSSIEELSDGMFKTVIDELDNIDLKSIKRVIICSGKVYYDLLDQRRKNMKTDISIIRIEQLYPFPYEDIKKILIQFITIKDFVWCQEEPLNQGAWFYCQNVLRDVIPVNATLSYIGREASSSPAVGCVSVHNEQQKSLVNNALMLNNLKG
ncbi:2-oxoglutarate dehydrogenase E1 component [Candidatus Providencia siddallii]|uniref:2-oxoglutarate dehydrogenase E1 component n=1 Tax=Candidatus Providencia siddallii TaxID=1715285 RepID=A0A0M6WAN4_9GAMM|nr:2-oxoglutarate dehydrogenase E1 component [Candidatus Providencia siddallii]